MGDDEAEEASRAGAIIADAEFVQFDRVLRRHGRYRPRRAEARANDGNNDHEFGKADGLDALETVERPGEAGRRILSAGEENEGAAHQAGEMP